MKKFEYLKTVNSTIQELNELGSIGWELMLCNVEKREREYLYNIKEGNKNYKIEKIYTYVYTFKKEINE